MRLRDITVEVRDKTLTRIGLIRPEELDLELTDAHNNTGSWVLKLAAEHPLAAVLRQPGSGIIVTGPDSVLFSGPVIKPEYAATATDPGGTVTFEGADDTIILADRLAFPQPSNPDPQTQTAAHHTLTGPAESLMHAFASANIGPAAPVPRRHPRLAMGANGARGPVVTKSARFPVLGSLLSELAVVAGLGFRVVQRGAQLVFETYAVTDRSATVRLDVYNNTLSAHRVAVSPPGATQVIVAGQGELTQRQFLALTTPAAQAAETLWGRRIERFVDQRNTSDVAELTQAGMEVLTEEGNTALAVQAVPMEDTSDSSTGPAGMRFGRDWGLGDKISVVVDRQELASTVTGYVLKASSEGFRLGALIGDPTGFDPDAVLSRRVQSTENRVSALERTAENSAALDTGWHPVTLAGTWVAAGTPLQAPRYRMLATGQVEIQGSAAGGTAGPVFTLPAGHRPAARLQFTAAGSDPPARVEITPDGVLARTTGAGLLSLAITYTPG